MATMNISLPQTLRDFVEAQVATGRYANASDFVRDLIRTEFDKAEALAELNAEIQKGLESGDAGPLDFDDIWQRALSRYESFRAHEATQQSAAE